MVLPKQEEKLTGSQSVQKEPAMDDANRKAVEVLNTQGDDAYMKHVFTDQKDDNKRELSYMEMRMLYG